MGLVAGIIGAAGYAGAELVRILSRHPEFDLRVITSSTDEGLSISELYPAFKGVCDLEFSVEVGSLTANFVYKFSLFCILYGKLCKIHRLYRIEV